MIAKKAIIVAIEVIMLAIEAIREAIVENNVAIGSSCYGSDYRSYVSERSYYSSKETLKNVGDLPKNELSRFHYLHSFHDSKTFV